MTGPADDGAPRGDGGDGHDDAHSDPPHPGPSHRLRGVGVVVVAVVIGALLMPSATRPPLHVVTAASSSSTTTTPPRGTTSTTTTTLPTVVPGASSIHVLVANATTVPHLAAGVATYLRSRGYVTLTPVNASTHVSATQVFAAAGQQGAAGTVVSVLGLSAAAIQPSSAVAPVASTGGATVVVIVGPDLDRLAPPATTASTTG
jgi:hypothetical protein